MARVVHFAGRKTLRILCGHEGRDPAVISMAHVTCPRCLYLLEPLLLARAGLQRAKEDRMEDFVFIGGLDLPVWQAAQRLGLCERTIQRYRAQLRKEKVA